jgi:hypothetical protein
MTKIHHKEKKKKKKLIPAPEICVMHGSRMQAFLK